MGFYQLPSTIIFDDPHTQTTPPNFTSYTSKMRNRCKNNYIEAFGAVYWAKNVVLRNLGELPSPFEGRGLMEGTPYSQNYSMNADK